jgi:hypothetical protein
MVGAPTETKRTAGIFHCADTIGRHGAAACDRHGATLSDGNGAGPGRRRVGCHGWCSGHSVMDAGCS